MNPIRPTVLHRDLPNLEALVASQSCSDDLLQFWENELHLVVDRGKRRAETVYVFGALLVEWDDAADAERIAQEHAAHQRLLSEVCSPSAETPMEILDAILANFAEHRQAIQRDISNRMAKSEHGATGGWYSLQDNPHVPSHVRQEAHRFSSDTVLENQFNDALSAATRDPSAWN
ncbi:MAG: hypothetical protein NXI04_03285 [Planctomycetaceae bacterium]|nr:hypothetical protein [Planctomycetaceae bacterium]